MKVISVKQPWGSLLVSGLKNIENRTWSTPYRGWLLIHASQTGMPSYVLSNDFQKNALKSITNNGNSMLPFSSIIGACLLDDITFGVDGDNRWSDKNCFHWHMSRAIKFDKPIDMVKGKLKIWEFNLPEKYEEEFITKSKNKNYVFSKD